MHSNVHTVTKGLIESTREARQVTIPGGGKDSLHESANEGAISVDMTVDPGIVTRHVSNVKYERPNAGKKLRTVVRGLRGKVIEKIGTMLSVAGKDA